ncbi:hypothetical protein [Actinomadura yumaensis]|uniref:Uncharacterized protein n=1 Tax=Actinomadura yumaensis TaxID=111807 RepID=A0ABW2D1W2_9ACTN
MPTTIRGSAERLVVAGTMAPTIHDVHAWRFKVTPELIEVHADPARFRPMDDPSGRGLHLSCGAALVNLRLAAAQLGYAAVVRLLPDPERPAVLAAARLAGRHRVTRWERLLYAATLRPFPSNALVSFDGRGRDGVDSRPSRRVMDELAGVAKLEGTELHVLPGEESGSRRAVLTTRGDSRAEWLRAGQALQRVLLAGTARYVSTSFMYEVVDLPEASEVLSPGDFPQVMLEFTQHSPARVRLPQLLKPVEDGEHEGQRHWERVR